MTERADSPVGTALPTSTNGRAKRTFAKLVANETLEDYALRYAPSSFRKWSHYAVGSAAMGGIAYLADYAIGGSIFVTHGFASGIWAVIAAAVVIFLTGIPIAYYAAKYCIDMDLLTRGAGFGYLGSTITSIVYASFTLIFFSLEGSIMAQALQTSIGIPLPVGYLIVALTIIPLVVYGMTLLSKMQVWTQPIWFALMLMPIIAVLVVHPHTLSAWTHFAGTAKTGSRFNVLGFGLGAGVALSLIAQIGEQVDYLRFMPAKTPQTARSWWFTVMTTGPGWVVLGALKQLAGGFLAFYVFSKVGASKAVEPIIQVLGGYQVFVPGAALTLATLFVILSQIKINVTNAYSGSLSWSNFFSRVFHSHPGRVVWIFFNVGIALALMEAGVFGFLNTVLGFYSNVAIAWIGAIVADLVVNKPLGLSPSYIEFKRAHLYPVNPVGFGSMLVASGLSIAAFYNAFGSYLQAFSPFLALFVAFFLSPILAFVTKGRYYIAREDTLREEVEAGVISPTEEKHCGVCEEDYEVPDMAYCPYLTTEICSLCCTLEKTCHDVCKQPVNLRAASASASVSSTARA